MATASGISRRVRDPYQEEAHKKIISSPARQVHQLQSAISATWRQASLHDASPMCQRGESGPSSISRRCNSCLARELLFGVLCERAPCTAGTLFAFTPHAPKPKTQETCLTQQGLPFNPKPQSQNQETKSDSAGFALKP